MHPSRSLLLSIAVASFGLIGVAMYLQHGLDLLPCPLCVIQRYMFLGVGVASLVAAISGKVREGTVLALLAALGGLYTVGKHLYVIANPGFSCGIDPMETFLNKIPTAEYLPWLFRADGLCEGATDSLMGIAIPQWSAIWFVVLTVLLAFVLLRKKPQR